MHSYIGIDVGGTRLKAGLINETFQVLREEISWLEVSDQSEEGILKKIDSLVRAVQGPHRPTAIGLGIPGVIRATDGMVTESPNFPQWKNFKIKDRLENELGIDVYVGNDANCVIAGEVIAGAAMGKEHVLGFTLGTGVGGAIILGGTLWQGERGMAGELGHICVDPNGPPCGCGSNGCLESYASRVGLAHALRARPIDGIDPDAPDMPKQLSAAAQAGNTAALQHFRSAGTALGRAVGGLLNVLNIETVLLAGGLTPAWPLMEGAMRSEMKRTAFPGVVRNVQINIGTLGDQAGMIGAAFQWKMQ